STISVPSDSTVCPYTTLFRSFVRDAQDCENVERVISLGPREATLQLLPDGLKKVLIKLLIVFHFPFPPLRCIVLHRPLNILPHLLATSFNRHFPLQHLERTRLRLFLPEIGCVSLFLCPFDPQSLRLCFCAGCYFLITVRNRRQVPRMGIFL